MSDNIVQRDLAEPVSGEEQLSEDFTNQTESSNEVVSQGEVLNEGNANAMPDDLGLLLDINVTLAIEIGCKQMKINELMKLHKGSIIELDKAAGDPLDIKANGSLIARGEVVIANGKYGIRLTEVVSKSERKQAF